jgi:pyruvate dehydrogenase E2 component (dihydrolipoamide acetyltransferase)
MAISVVMPALEMAQESGTLLAWKKNAGDQVRKGEMLVEVETDKAVVEVEAAADGILGGILAQPGDVVPVGQTIAWLLNPGETPPADAVTAHSARKSTVQSPAVPSTDAATSDAVAASRHGRVSPKARRLAQELGVDLATVTGSGRGGEILAEDITTAAPATGRTDQSVSSIGRLMAERTTQSWTTVPHFFVTREVDATDLNTARERLRPLLEQSRSIKITHTDLFVAAVSRALRRHPRMNSSWTAHGIVSNEAIHVALAMAVENAVVTATIRNAADRSLADIATERHELAARARSNRLRPADVTGATFTVSNLGMFGVDAFTAIVVPPQAGILAIGAVAERVIVTNGAVVIRPTVNLTLSSDHRVVDGVRAAQFLNDVVIELGALGNSVNQ